MYPHSPIFSRINKIVLIKLAESLMKYVNNQWGLFVKSQIRKSSVISSTTNSFQVFDNFRTFINGSSKKLTSKAIRLAKSDASIMILGETGVGKTYLARLLHDSSNRKDMPFINVNISGLPENLVESELFGYEKGAFTGADRQKPGMVELANKGTLFIDELGDIPKSIQVKLLRVLEDKVIVRVGGTITKKIDFRIIAATNHDLEKDIENGSFRGDLYYRLSVFPLTVPPLRERKKEIVELSKYFLSYYSKKYRIAIPKLNTDNESILCSYHWPGNIRELKNIIEQAVLFYDEGELQFDMLHCRKKPCMADFSYQALFNDTPTLDDLQRRYIQQVLNKTGGQIGGPNGAARILGVKRTTLYKRMKKLGINKQNSCQIVNIT
jgi:transcriptional regulator with PAS, ATPase and Fis domain